MGPRLRLFLALLVLFLVVALVGPRIAFGATSDGLGTLATQIDRRGA
jgi:hypothetical protein